MIIALTIGCAKEQCEEIVTNVELGVTYTASSDGIITVENQSNCNVYLMNINREIVTSDENTNTFSIVKGQVYIIDMIGDAHYDSATDSIWYDECTGNAKATLKTICDG